MKSLGCSAALLLCAVFASQVLGQSIGGARAPTTGGGEVERARLLLDVADPLWGLSSAFGVAPRDTPLVLPMTANGGPIEIGINGRPPLGPISPETAGTLAVVGDTLIWRVRVDASGAGALRLHWTNLNLPQGATLNSCGVAAARHGGYLIRARGSDGSGSDWTPVLDGTQAYVEYQGPVSAGLPACSIDEVAEIAAPWPMVRPQQDLLPCEVDVQCQSPDATARDSVGYMVFSTPTSTLMCTGALLNDTDPNTTRGWLLTSRRCISTQFSASSLTVYWFYQTPSCNGAPPSLASLPTSQGATLLQATTASDLSFLQLTQDPTAGQGLAGWTTTEPTGSMMTIHHPDGNHKHAAVGAATTSSPICSGTLPYYQYHYLDYSTGITESGSTGAPLFNASWQVVGQLYGVCAISSPDCGNPAQWNAVFGRFSRSFALVASYLTGSASPSRIYVNAAATGANTGLSWTDAYTNLHAALIAAAPAVGGTEVWVAAGVYKPASSIESSFQLVSGVSLYGGFDGTETLLSQRNVANNVTVLSGDLGGNDAPNFVNRADNVYHVVRATGVDQTAVLDGFTVRGGNASGPQFFNSRGGGLYAEGAMPTIRNCTFTDNSASGSGGGAAYAEFANLDMQACTFTGNFAGSTGGAMFVLGGGGTLGQCIFTANSASNNGGGIDLYDAHPTISSCIFMQNNAGARGGGLNSFPSGAPVVQNCRFELNNAGYGGGGMNAFGPTVSLSGCTFLKNTAMFFGGALLHTNNAATTLSACRFLGNSSSLEGGAINANSGSLDMVNCEFSGNRTTANSGGAFFDTHNCIATVRSCSFSGNTANTGEGGAITVDDSTTSIVNSVFWGNTDASGPTQNGQVKLVTGGVTVNYSLLQGLSGSLGGSGNIGGNPVFLSALGADAVSGTEDDDLALGTGSAAIDAGDSQAASTIPTDLRGHIRREDDTCVANTGTGPNPPVDMGALEKSTCACYPNCDGSTVAPILNANDFSCFLNSFAAGESYANCDGSTVEPVLNANDFSCFLNSFAAGCT